MSWTQRDEEHAARMRELDRLIRETKARRGRPRGSRDTKPRKQRCDALGDDHRRAMWRAWAKKNRAKRNASRLAWWAKNAEYSRKVQRDRRKKRREETGRPRDAA